MNIQRVNKDRIWSSLMEIAKIGAFGTSGCRRLALSDEDRRARDLICQWAKEAGCEIHIDGIGNIFARRQGRKKDAPPIVMGSHIDTVPTGGRFDGIYGVVAALEVMRCLEDSGTVTEIPLEVAIWTNEEGARFSPMTMGSTAFTGATPLEFALSRTDDDGITVGQALDDIGYRGEASVGGRPFAAYLEVHIEQGPELKESGHQIGVVTGSYRARYFVATISGQAAHVGPTPMEDRRDAMVGAAELILQVDRIGRSRGRNGRSNSPHIEVFPNVRGVIPSEVRLSCDLRHPDADEVLAMEQELRTACSTIEDKLGVKIDLEQYFEFGPINCNVAMGKLVADTADSLGISHQNILTVAGHDAVPLMDYCPTALFFIPSDNGISHNETEYSTPEQCVDGADVLLNAILKLASSEVNV